MDNKGDRGTIYYTAYAPSCLIKQVAYLGHDTALFRHTPPALSEQEAEKINRKIDRKIKAKSIKNQQKNQDNFSQIVYKINENQ